VSIRQACRKTDRKVEEPAIKNSLRVRRAERGWSQADLAERLDVSRQTVNAIETSKYDPSLPLAFKIARLFETSIEELFNPAETLASDGQPHQAGQGELMRDPDIARARLNAVGRRPT
jgi:putative transcriptional regulator